MIRLLNSRFVSVAENCTPLQTQDDDKGRFFRKVAEQGHYAGRVVPSATRQGQYAFTADGTLLASCNKREAADLLTMLNAALERWEQRSSTGGSDDAHPQPYLPDPKYPSLYPADGLVLRVVSRDLPRSDDRREPDWRTNALNLDFAWFTADEAAALVPEQVEPGASRQISQALANRIARFHILDNVRGETPAWNADEVDHAELSATVEQVDGESATIRYRGTIANQARGIWAIRPFQERLERERGIRADLVGVAVYNLKSRRFERFDLVAVAERSGGTEHNCRWDDENPNPVGISFTLAGSEPRERVPPHANLWDYFGLEPGK